MEFLRTVDSSLILLVSAKTLAIYLQLFPTRYKFGRSKGTHYNFVYSIRFRFLLQGRSLLWFVSGQWLRSWGKEWVCDFFHSIEKTRVTLMKWSNGIQTPKSLLFFLKIVRSRISCEHGEAARRETRVSRLCRSTLSELGKDKTRYFWCDTRGSTVISFI